MPAATLAKAAAVEAIRADRLGKATAATRRHRRSPPSTTADAAAAPSAAAAAPPAAAGVHSAAAAQAAVHGAAARRHRILAVGCRAADHAAVAEGAGAQDEHPGGERVGVVQLPGGEGHLEQGTLPPRGDRGKREHGDERLRIWLCGHAEPKGEGVAVARRWEGRDGRVTERVAAFKRKEAARRRALGDAADDKEELAKREIEVRT